MIDSISPVLTSWGQVTRDLIMGGGGVQGQGKGQQLMSIFEVIFEWQHAKVKSMKSNPPLKSSKICH